MEELELGLREAIKCKSPSFRTESGALGHNSLALPSPHAPLRAHRMAPTLRAHKQTTYQTLECKLVQGGRRIKDEGATESHFLAVGLKDTFYFLCKGAAPLVLAGNMVSDLQGPDVCTSRL